MLAPREGGECVDGRGRLCVLKLEFIGAVWAYSGVSVESMRHDTFARLMLSISISPCSFNPSHAAHEAVLDGEGSQATSPSEGREGGAIMT